MAAKRGRHVLDFGGLIGLISSASPANTTTLSPPPGGRAEVIARGGSVEVLPRGGIVEVLNRTGNEE